MSQWRSQHDDKHLAPARVFYYTESSGADDYVLSHFDVESEAGLQRAEKLYASLPWGLTYTMTAKPGTEEISGYLSEYCDRIG